MREIKRRGALFSVGALVIANPLGAQILGTSARQLNSGSLKFMAYYQGTHDQSLTLSLANPGSCSVATTGGNVGFACGQTGEVEAKGSGGMGLVKLVYQPWDNFQYYASVGVGDYSLKVPSTTVTNTLTGDNLGSVFTLGGRAVIYPDTIVTPAIALDVSISRSRYAFNRRFPGGTPGQNNNVNQRLDLTQYQFAVESSHLFTMQATYKLEPYGGVKWSRIQSDLKDLTDGGHAGGQQDVVTPFLGLRVPVYEHEVFFAEASFVGGYQYAAGIELRFH